MMINQLFRSSTNIKCSSTLLQNQNYAYLYNNNNVHVIKRSYSTLMENFFKEIKEKENNPNNNNNKKTNNRDDGNNENTHINRLKLDLLSLNNNNNNNNNNSTIPITPLSLKNNTIKINNNSTVNKSMTREELLKRQQELQRFEENQTEEDDDDDEDYIDNIRSNGNEDRESSTTGKSERIRPSIKRSKKHRQLINPLTYRLLMAIDPPKWNEIYDNPSLPMHIDLGCAKGEMLVKLSVLKPDFNYLGIDIRDHCIEMAKNSHKLLEFELNRDIKNLHFIQTNASSNLFNIAKSLPPNTHIQKMSILFPDPWHKRKHIKRRIVNANFVREVAMVTPVGAKIYIMSDVFELYDEMLNYFVVNPSFQSIDFTKDEWDIEVTARQNYYMEKDIPFWRAVLVRV